MRITETKVYTIEEHPNKDKCFEWIRDNWHDLNQYSVDELIKSAKELSNVIGGTYNYSISQVPNRGEHITFKGYSHEELYKLSTDDCPLTGVCWDIELIVGLRNGNASEVLNSLHSDTEYQYSDEGLYELCEANQYEFDEEGNIV